MKCTRFKSARANFPYLNMPAFSRRAALAFANGLIMSSWLKPVPAAAQSTRIAIIGAGLAGLSAAITLHDHGLHSQIYEANNRVGGRVYSRKSGWLNRQISEWGAELIDSTHNTMHRLVHRFGLELENRQAHESSDTQMTYFFNKKYYSQAEITAEFQAIYPQIQIQLRQVGQRYNAFSHTPFARKLDDTDAASWLADLLGGSLYTPLGKLLEAAYITENGAQLQEQSALSILTQLGEQPAAGFSLLGDSDEKYHIKGGNDQLPQAMAAHLPSNTIHYEHKIEAIRRTIRGYTLYFTGKNPVQADVVILAIPAAIMQSIDLSQAGISADKIRTIHAIRTGHCTKLNLQFSDKTWLGRGRWPGLSTGEAFTDLPMQQIWEASACQPGNTGILIQYAGGDFAKNFTTRTGFSQESDQNKQEVIYRILEQIDRIYPGTSPLWNQRYALSTWHTNPYARGAYTYFPVGYMTRYSGKERERQGNIFFAGEYCSQDYIGFMNGAAEEGIRAAREIIMGRGK